MALLCCKRMIPRVFCDRENAKMRKNNLEFNLRIMDDWFQQNNLTLNSKKRTMYLSTFWYYVQLSMQIQLEGRFNSMHQLDPHQIFNKQRFLRHIKKLECDWMFTFQGSRDIVPTIRYILDRMKCIFALLILWCIFRTDSNIEKRHRSQHFHLWWFKIR